MVRRKLQHLYISWPGETETYRRKCKDVSKSKVMKW